MVKTPTGYFSPSCGGGGGSGKQVRSQGGLQKFPFLVTKWAKNGVILVGLGLGPLEGKFTKFFSPKGPLFCGGPTPFQNKSWLRAWWKDCATCHFNRAVILKEEGCCRVKNGAVNRKSVERAIFCFFVFFSVFVLFCFSFVLFCFVFCFFVFLFVCLFDWFF